MEEVTDPLKLEEYDQVIWLIIEELLRKNVNQDLASMSAKSIQGRLEQLIQDLIADQREDLVIDTLKKVQKRLLALEVGHEEVKEEAKSVKQMPLAVGQIERLRNDQERLESWKTKLACGGNVIDWAVAEKAIQSFCLKPHYLGELYEFLLKINQSATVDFLLRKKNNVKLPPSFLITLLQEFLSQSLSLSQVQRTLFGQYLSSQVDRKVSPQ